MKLPSRKSVTLLCVASDSTSKRKRTKTSAKPIGRRLWHRSSSATAKSTSSSIFHISSLDISSSSSNSHNDSNSPYNSRPKRGVRRTQKLIDNSHTAKEVATVKGEKGRARDPQGSG